LSVLAIAKSGLGAAAGRTGLARRLQSALAARGWFPILGYHRVVADPASMADDITLGLAITRREFEAHAAHLASEWSVVPLSEALRLSQQGAALEPGTCALTFDDGWADTYEAAFPVLRRFGLTATVFVATEYVDSDRTLPTTHLYRALARQSLRDGESLSAARARYHDVKRAGPQTITASLSALGVATAPCETRDRMLTWAQVRELSTAGWEIGCHGHTHVPLGGLSATALARETVGAREVLGSRIDNPVTGMCYPQGDWDAEAAAACASAGFEYACASDRGWARPDSRPHALPRVLLGPGTATSESAAGLSVALLRAALARPRAAPPGGNAR
jgi:peptidoglycan/xylan/chitin deacetylase (PgdA/CDA1 family)